MIKNKQMEFRRGPLNLSSEFPNQIVHNIEND